MRRLFFLAILIQVSLSVALGQQSIGPCPKQRIAFYNKSAFDDEKGVSRLYEANKVVDKLVGDMGPNPTAAQIEASRNWHQSYRRSVVDPILTAIDLSIEVFKAAQGFRLFDGVDMEEKGLFLAVDKKFDVTTQLIKYLNLSPDKQGTIPQLTVESSRIGKIDSHRLFDPQRGIKNFDPLKSPDFSETYRELNPYLDDYAVKNGFSVIFDSNKSLDPNIEKLVCEDVTDDFIAAFNKHLNGDKN